MAQAYGNGGGFTVRMAGPVATGGTTSKLADIVIPASGWKGGESPFSQVVEIDKVSVNSKVDLQPDVELLETLRDKDISLVAKNDAGVVTVYAIGEKPTADLTMQVSITEVVA
jgi:hypothetical protein